MRSSVPATPSDLVEDSDSKWLNTSGLLEAFAAVWLCSTMCWWTTSCLGWSGTIAIPEVEAKIRGSDPPLNCRCSKDAPHQNHDCKVKPLIFQSARPSQSGGRSPRTKLNATLDTWPNQSQFISKCSAEACLPGYPECWSRAHETQRSRINTVPRSRTISQIIRTASRTQSYGIRVRDVHGGAHRDSDKNRKPR